MRAACDVCDCIPCSKSPALALFVSDGLLATCECSILDGLRQAGVKLALASRTPTPHVASAFLDKLGLRQRFHRCNCMRNGCLG